MGMWVGRLGGLIGFGVGWKGGREGRVILSMRGRLSFKKRNLLVGMGYWYATMVPTSGSKV